MENLKNDICKLIEQDQLWKFYKSKEWLRLKENVLKKFHYECQECKKNGKITKADTVHHVKHVRKFPELALSEYYTDTNRRQQRNLVPICKACHNKAHPEKREIFIKKLTENQKDKFKNEEKW